MVACRSGVLLVCFSTSFLFVSCVGEVKDTECSIEWYDVEFRAYCCDPRYEPDGPEDCVSSRGSSFRICCSSGTKDGFVSLAEDIREAGVVDFDLVQFLTAPPFHPRLVELFPLVCSPLREGRYDRQCDIMAYKWFHHEDHSNSVPTATVCDEVGEGGDHVAMALLDFCTTMYLRIWQYAVWRRDEHRGHLSRSKCTYALQLLYFSQASTLAMMLDRVAQLRQEVPRSALMAPSFYWWREERARRCAVAEQRMARRTRHPSPGIPERSAPQGHRVGLILSVAYNTRDSPLTRSAVGMWRCYAARHGYEVVVDDEEYDGYDPLHTVRYPRAVWPLRFVIGKTGEPREVSVAQPSSVGWIKWRAASRWLYHYDAIIVADAADMVVSFSCYDIPLHQFLADGADVVLRDVPDRTELNGGLAIIRKSFNGRHFLDILLGYASIYGLPFVDQDALALTVLQYATDEMSGRLSEEGVVGNNTLYQYSSSCLSEVLPFRSLLHSVADLTYCVLTELARIAGPFGARATRSIKFVDPRVVDINFKTPRADINTTGFVVHFAGMSKKYQIMQAYLARYDGFDLRAFEDVTWREVCDSVILKGGFEECTPVGVIDPDCHATICG
ncbi:hypothetical protein FOL46_002480 [Perkinsus olseni]|uniref:Uncharacterized protein n=1 Tax=Perkinsus olseni TaxID=32597 RepID=A0A7J6MUN4_PEROL|nr:hypothetical protein FOL46_002480 [Perkinsus olseni]